MPKSRRNSSRSYSNSMKMLKRTSIKTTQGLKSVGAFTKNAIQKSSPIVEKGAANVYKALATGFNMGLNAAKLSSRKRSRRHGRSRRRR